MNKKGISLVGIKDIDTIKRIRESYPDCYFELSYLSTPSELKEILPIVKYRVASIHLLAPVKDYFPNLASFSSYEWSEKAILENAELAKEIGAENLVLHPGYLVDGLVSRDYQTRLTQLKNLNMEEYMLQKEESVAAPSYIKSERYKKAFKIMVENALKLNKKINNLGLNLTLENLNPRVGYMNLLPEESIYLASLGLDLCIDVGHLFINSIIFGFDCLSQTKLLLDTGRVKTMHLHSNPSHVGYYKDSHLSFDKYMPYYKEIISYASSKGANLILESIEEPERNVGLLFN